MSAGLTTVVLGLGEIGRSAACAETAASESQNAVKNKARILSP